MDDRNNRLLAAAKLKSENCYKRAVNVIARLADEGMPISFSRVSKESGLSRTYLYSNLEIRHLIEGQRSDSAQRHEVSMNTVVQLQRIEIRRLQAELKKLKASAAKAESLAEENKKLKEQLRAAYKY